MAKRKAVVGDRVEFYMGREDGWCQGTVRIATRCATGDPRKGKVRKLVHYGCDNGDPGDDDPTTNGYTMWAVVTAKHIRKEKA